MLDIANLFEDVDEDEEMIVSDDMLVSDDENPNQEECYSMSTGEFEVPHTNDPTTGTVVNETSKEIPVTRPKKDGATMANMLVASALSLVNVVIVVLARRSKKFCATLGLSDDFKLMPVQGKVLVTSDFPECPADKPLRVFDLERNGYRFLFDPEGDTSSSSLTKRREQAGADSLLQFLVNESGILNEEPSVKLIVDAVLNNTGKDGNMTMKAANDMLKQAFETGYLRTKRTTRSLKVLIDTAESAYPTNPAMAWKMCRRCVNRAFDAAKTLHAENPNAVARMSFVLIPELTGLDKDERIFAENVFAKHDELFSDGYNRLNTFPLTSENLESMDTETHSVDETNHEIVPNLKYWSHDAFSQTADGIFGTPRMELTNGQFYDGPVILRAFENDRRHPTYRLMSKVVRYSISKETKNDTQLESAPRLVASFSGPGKVFLQADAAEEREVDLTPFAVALRIAEIQNRKDLSSITKAKVLADYALLSSVDAPEYVRGKKSHIILAKSRLQCGNDFDESGTALSLTNERICEILKNVIEVSRSPK